MQLIGIALVRLLDVIIFAILIRVVVSWIPVSRNNAFIRLVYQVTEPILGPIRALIQKSEVGRNMMIDFSPIIAFLLIQVVQRIIANAFGVGMIVG
ncbi:MAG: YggT family protein [Clostridia bacterium]|nr:YggT family protein [Clostridia bacterium]